MFMSGKALAFVDLLRIRWLVPFLGRGCDWAASALLVLCCAVHYGTSIGHALLVHPLLPWAIGHDAAHPS